MVFTKNWFFWNSQTGPSLLCREHSLQKCSAIKANYMHIRNRKIRAFNIPVHIPDISQRQNSSSHKTKTGPKPPTSPKKKRTPNASHPPRASCTSTRCPGRPIPTPDSRSSPSHLSTRSSSLANSSPSEARRTFASFSSDSRCARPRGGTAACRASSSASRRERWPSTVESQT